MEKMILKLLTTFVHLQVNVRQLSFTQTLFQSYLSSIDGVHWLLDAMDLTDYSFLPDSLVYMIIYFGMFSTDEGYIPIFSYTKLFLADLRPNNKVVFSRTAQET